MLWKQRSGAGRLTFSVDTLAMRSSKLIRSASMKRSFFPVSCVTKRRKTFCSTAIFHLSSSIFLLCTTQMYLFILILALTQSGAEP